MSRVVITGGTGFLGRHVAKAFQASGHDVTCFDLAPWPSAPTQIDCIQGSILDEAALAAAIEDAELVIHLAANAQLWAKDPAVFEAVNHQGTRRVLEAARAANVRRTVVASSLVILAPWNRPAPNPIDEVTPRPPLSELAGPYCRSKWAADAAVAEAQANGQDVVSLYCGAPVGPGDVNVTPPTAMFRDLWAGRIPAYLDCTLNLVDVEALAQAFEIAAGHPNARGGYIATGPDLPMREVLKMFGNVSGKPMPRRTVPYWLAETAAKAAEVAANLSGRPPQAPLAGVRLAKYPRAFSTERIKTDLGWSAPSIDRALVGLVQEFQRQAA